MGSKKINHWQTLKRLRLIQDSFFNKMTSELWQRLNNKDIARTKIIYRTYRRAEILVGYFSCRFINMKLK